MKTLLYIVSTLLVIGTLLPVSDSKHWFVRGQAYFRFWYLCLLLIITTLWLFYIPITLEGTLALVVLLLCIGLCLRDVLPFTPWYRREIRSVKGISNSKNLSFLIFNVYQENEDYQKLLDKVKTLTPDIILLLETNSAWDTALASLENSYPYIIKEIREDTYGIVLYSKIKPEEQRIDYLTDNGIPSIDCLLKIEQHKIRIRGLHPRPPIPGEALSSEQKDDEFSKAAKLLNNLPSDEISIVIGDLNDVAWSKASKRFKQTTGLKDPRVGRGSYSTFPTYSPVRFPLDHIFCSTQLEIMKFEVIENLGSDHFPIYISFSLPSTEQ